jgi:hypothetical protein
VLRDCGPRFVARFGLVLTAEQRRAIRDLVACRTAALGGHVEACDCCAERRVSYNSCRNRHCPKCPRADGPVAQTRSGPRATGGVLPCGVHGAGGSCRPGACEPAGALRAVVQSELGDDSRRGRRSQAPRGRGRSAVGAAHLGPGASASPTRPQRGHRWRAGLRADGPTPHGAGGRIGPGSSCRCGCSVGCSRASSSRVCTACSTRESCGSSGRCRGWQMSRCSGAGCWHSTRGSGWFTPSPFGGPTVVLKYLARYVHRVAISNRRLVSWASDVVTFTGKDCANGGRMQTHRLSGEEFVRRFLT